MLSNRVSNSLMSSTRQHVQRGDSFTGFGYLPDFTPAHHELLLTGMIGGTPLLLSPRICHNRKSPYCGKLNSRAFCLSFAVIEPSFSTAFSFVERNGFIIFSTSCVISEVN